MNMTQRIHHLFLHSPALLTATAILCFLSTGCVGRREALRVNESIITSSQRAAVTIQALQTATTQEVEAHRKARQACRELASGFYTNRLDLARQQMEAEQQKTLNQINTAWAEALNALGEQRRQKGADLEVQLAAQMRPLYDRIKEYQTRANEAFEQFKASPNELSLRQSHILADKDYLAAQGAALDMKLDALRLGLAELDRAEAEARARLSKIAEDHRNRATALYQAASRQLPAATSAPVNLGPEPPSQEDVYLGLAEYARAVQAAAEGNRDYLIGNSLGKGSFFADFWSSLGRGVLGGIVKPSSVKDINAQDVLGAGREVLSDGLGSLKEQLRDASATFQTVARESVQNILGQGMDGALRRITRFVDDKLQPPQTDSSKTARPGSP